MNPAALIIAAAKEKKDNLSKAFGNFANQQTQVANTWNGGAGFTPMRNELQPLQTNNNTNLVSRLGSVFNKPQAQTTSTGAIGQEIQNQVPQIGSNLFDLLKG